MENLKNKVRDVPGFSEARHFIKDIAPFAAEEREFQQTNGRDCRAMAGNQLMLCRNRSARDLFCRSACLQIRPVW
jgi:hypothetical protein